MEPQDVIIDIKDFFQDLRRKTIEIDLPVMDRVAIMKTVVESIHHASVDYDAIDRLAVDIVEYSHLSNGDDFDNNQADAQQRVLMELLKLKQLVFQELVAYGFYRNGTMPYKFKEFINERTILLTRRTEVVLWKPNAVACVPRYYHPKYC